ncbi:hypothetical protein [Dyella silvatica]|uniref:hypothetical protein n=1 Tax=Dyella silvatica TaxID=2992128 RepID=UPI002255600D|nr:hypothetical protein [Dyella silvatica]
MFGLFRKGSLLGEELTQWQFDCFAWLLRHSGGFAAFQQRQLIQPTAQCFARQGAQGHAFAEVIFTQVKQHAGMAAWPCSLQVQEDDPNLLVGRALLIQGVPATPGGTFHAGEDGVVITYHPRNVSDGMVLIATFAHELAHYRTAGFEEAPPGGWEIWEPATDLAAVFLGFGIFLANSHFSFAQHSDGESMGWRAERRGYLSEPELLHMHAIFTTLLNIPTSETLKHLKPSLRGIFKRVHKDVGRATEAIDSLRGIAAMQPA